MAEAVVCQVWFTAVPPATQEDRLISEILEQLGTTDRSCFKQEKQKSPWCYRPSTITRGPCGALGPETEQTTCISVASRDADAASLWPHCALAVVCHCVSLCVTVCHCIPCHCVSLCVTVCHCMSLCVPACHCMSLCVMALHSFSAF